MALPAPHLVDFPSQVYQMHICISCAAYLKKAINEEPWPFPDKFFVTKSTRIMEEFREVLFIATRASNMKQDVHTKFTLDLIIDRCQMMLATDVEHRPLWSFTLSSLLTDIMSGIETLKKSQEFIDKQDSVEAAFKSLVVDCSSSSKTK